MCIHTGMNKPRSTFVPSTPLPPPSFDPIMSIADGKVAQASDPLGFMDDDAPASGAVPMASPPSTSASSAPDPGTSSVANRLLAATAVASATSLAQELEDDEERVERAERAEIPFDLEKHVCIVVPANILKRPASIRGLVTQAVSRAVPLTPSLLAALQRTQESEERKVREEEEEERRAPPPKPTRRIGKIVGVRAPTLDTAFWTDVDFSRFSTAVGARVVRYDQLADDEKCDLLIVVGQTVGTRFSSDTARDILREGTRDVAAPAVLFALFSSSGAPGVFNVERPGIPNYEGSISFQIVTDEEPHFAVPNAGAVAKIRDVLDSR